MSNDKQEIGCFNAGYWNGFRKKTGENNSVTVLTIHWNQCQHLKGQNFVKLIYKNIWDPSCHAVASAEVLKYICMLSTRPQHSFIEDTCTVPMCNKSFYV